MKRLYLFPVLLVLCATISCIFGPKDGETNQSPAFSGGLPTKGTVGTEITATLHAKDADGDALSFAVLQGPTGMTLTDSILTWTPTLNDTGRNAVSIQVSDGRDGFDTLNGTIAVVDSNHTPVFLHNMIYDSIGVGASIRYLLTDSVANSDSDHLDFTILDSVPGASIGLFAYVLGTDYPLRSLTYSAPNAYSDTTVGIGVQVSDGRGKYDTLSLSIYIDPPPQITGRTPSTSADTIVVGRQYTTTLHVRDIGSSPLIFSFMDSASGMVLNDSVLTWTPDTGNAGGGWSYKRVKIRVEDPRGGMDTISWLLKVEYVLFERVVNSALFGSRYGQTLTAWNGKLWLIGGADQNDSLKNDVWSSSDGVDWIEVRDSADFSPRMNHGAIVFNNKLWVVGGAKGTWAGYSGLHDIWYSSDGANWIQATDSANFPPRSGFGLLTFQNKMWVMAGYNGQMRSDIWSSTDGITWACEKDSAVFGQRYAFGATQFDNKMWVMGGTSNFYQDVWNTSDGITWNKVSQAVQNLERRGIALTVWQGKIWRTGNSDILSSFDGSKWIVTDTDLYYRYSSAAVFNDRLWLIGGQNADASIWRSK